MITVLSNDFLRNVNRVIMYRYCHVKLHICFFLSDEKSECSKTIMSRWTEAGGMQKLARRPRRLCSPRAVRARRGLVSAHHIGYSDCMEILHNGSQDLSLSQTHNCVNHLGLFTAWNVTAASHFPLSLSLPLLTASPQQRDDWCGLLLIFDWQNKHRYHNGNAGRQTTSNNRGWQTHRHCDSIQYAEIKL